ncbi:hypothetical protein HMPREF0580_1947 [Mobiluncus mulieris ATCC 35239]|uniref:Transposase IS204/IS1001/IS1096/IS1165 DDE domain-containing protein n=1 Tax=Mobiluncus mulieris ATCC 35239 TaxID=871571 RepID=E0QST2_9ACTO|nr:hypothetical protein HMPREF0580_1947 [Mobiluncus mulieris ATCC 35239]
MKRRAADILAYFDHPHSSNGSTEAINGRLEHLRGSALGFRNLIHYRIRALLETGISPFLISVNCIPHPCPPRNRRIQKPTTPLKAKSL